MKLCVFPNDPLQAYYDKGEIKERYYNPKDVFDEIHFISLIEKDIEISKIQTIGGTAKIRIHSVGKMNIRNRKKFVKKIIALVSEINPDIIRSYNPFIEGWLAANCAKKLKKPFVLSLHTQIDYKRKLARKRSLKKYLVLKYFEKKIEPYVIKNANKILIVYKNIEPYVKKHKGQNIEVLHNNIEINKFRNAGSVDLPKPLILSVGNLSEDKNHQCLIKAM